MHDERAKKSVGGAILWGRFEYSAIFHVSLDRTIQFLDRKDEGRHVARDTGDKIGEVELSLP